MNNQNKINNMKFADIHSLPLYTEFEFDRTKGLVPFKFISVAYGGSSGGTSKREITIDEKNKLYNQTGIILKKNRRTTVVGFSTPYISYGVFDKKTKKVYYQNGLIETEYYISVDSQITVLLRRFDIIKNNGKIDFTSPNY